MSLLIILFAFAMLPIILAVIVVPKGSNWTAFPPTQTWTMMLAVAPIFMMFGPAKKLYAFDEQTSVAEFQTAMIIFLAACEINMLVAAFIEVKHPLFGYVVCYLGYAFALICFNNYRNAFMAAVNSNE